MLSSSEAAYTTVNIAKCLLQDKMSNKILIHYKLLVN